MSLIYRVVSDFEDKRIYLFKCLDLLILAISIQLSQSECTLSVIKVVYGNIEV